MWYKITRDWIKLNNKKLQGFYSSPNNIRIVESRNMKYAGHETIVGRK
jgi:hypothetical protein